MKNEKKLWERLNGESEQAYSAFKIFLQMESRTISAVGKKCGKSRNLIDRWAKKYFWRERADAWDNSLLENFRKSQIKKRKKDLELEDKAGHFALQKAMEILQNANTKKGSFYAAAQLMERAFKCIHEAYEFGKNENADDSTITINITRAKNEN